MKNHSLIEKANITFHLLIISFIFNHIRSTTFRCLVTGKYPHTEIQLCCSAVVVTLQISKEFDMIVLYVPTDNFNWLEYRNIVSLFNLLRLPYCKVFLCGNKGIIDFHLGWVGKRVSVFTTVINLIWERERGAYDPHQKGDVMTMFITDSM